jgi:ribosomal protein S27AE
MKEIKRAFHKQRKWICPKCGRARFQILKKENK